MTLPEDLFESVAFAPPGYVNFKVRPTAWFARLPRAEEITVRVLGQERRIRTGTRVMDLLPAELSGDLVVAGLLGQKPVALSTPVFTPTTVAPLTLSHWEGRQIYAQSMGLLLLEAAHRVAPQLLVRMGPSRGTRQVVDVTGDGAGDRGALAARIARARRGRTCHPLSRQLHPASQRGLHADRGVHPLEVGVLDVFLDPAAELDECCL